MCSSVAVRKRLCVKAAVRKSDGMYKCWCVMASVSEASVFKSVCVCVEASACKSVAVEKRLCVKASVCKSFCV